MKRGRDWIGVQFDRWEVIARDPDSSSRNPRLLVKCSCGRVKSVLLGHLRSGESRSCGCLQIEELVTRNRARRVLRA
jgi:hypothetical protein